MANTAALLQNLLRCKADYNFAVLQNSLWASKQEANASKLAAQQSAQEKWTEAYDDAYDCGHHGGDNDKVTKGSVTIKAGCTSEAQFSAYAYACSRDYDPEALEEYEDLDTTYDLNVTTYDAMITELSAMIEGYEESLGNSAQDTGLIGG